MQPRRAWLPRRRMFQVTKRGDSSILDDVEREEVLVAGVEMEEDGWGVLEEDDAVDDPEDGVPGEEDASSRSSAGCRFAVGLVVASGERDLRYSAYESSISESVIGLRSSNSEARASKQYRQCSVVAIVNGVEE